MNKDFDTEIISINEKIRGGYTYILSNLSKIIAIITAAVTTMLAFTDIAFLGISSREFSTSLMLILISSYIMYFSLEEAGEKLYEDSEDYRALTEEYRQALEKINLDKLPDMRKYLEWYADEELIYRKRQMLLSSGLTEEEYQGSHDKITDPRKRLALKSISGIKRLNLTPELILSRSATKGERISDPGKRKLLMLTIKILPSTVCAFFTASIVLATKELDAVTILESIMKLSMLPIIGFRGYVNGYNYKKDDEMAWIKTKIKLINGFLAQYANDSLQKH